MVKVEFLNTGSGNIKAHRAGCRDMARERTRHPHGSYWTEEVANLRDVAAAVYDPEDFEYDLATEWRGFIGDIDLFPCIGQLAAPTE